MTRTLPFICQQCRTRLLTSELTTKSPSTWQQKRGITRHLERRRPVARMVLSPKVARGDERSGKAGRPSRADVQSPFGGLNQTFAGVSRIVRRSKPAPDFKRSTKSREAPQKVRETFHALKMQRSLAAIPYGHRATVKDKLLEYQSFDDFKLLPDVKQAIYSQALSGMTHLTPTPVQRLAIPALLGQEVHKRRRKAATPADSGPEQFLLAAETGSGKTLAYLLPLAHAIKESEMSDSDIQSYKRAFERRGSMEKEPLGMAQPEVDAPHPTTGRPRAIVLVPTSELVSQVGRVAKSLSHGVKFRTALLSSAYSGQVIRNRLFSPRGIDLVVTTPHLLSSIAESDPNILSRVTHLVIDEADSLLDRSFSPSTSAIVDKVTPSLRQLILCSATIPRSLDSYLNRRYFFI